MMYRLNGSWMAVWMMASPTSELVNPRSENIRKIGVSRAWYGMIRASSRTTNSGSLNGTGKRASP